MNTAQQLAENQRGKFQSVEMDLRSNHIKSRASEEEWTEIEGLLRDAYANCEVQEQYDLATQDLLYAQLKLHLHNLQERGLRENRQELELSPWFRALKDLMYEVKDQATEEEWAEVEELLESSLEGVPGAVDHLESNIYPMLRRRGQEDQDGE